MRKTFFTHLLIYFLFICSAITAYAQQKLSDAGTAEFYGTSSYEPSLAPVVFLDQAPNQVNGLFSDSYCLSCGTTQQSIADNFFVAVTGPSYAITEIVMWGGYFPENIPNTTDNFTVILHNDAAGSPGTDLYVLTGLQPTRATTGVVLFGVDEYKFTFDFSSTPMFIPTAGTYWVEIFNNSVESSNFFWETGNLDANLGIMGSTWITTAPGTPPWNIDTGTDLSIQINGVDAFPPPVPTLVSPVNGATNIPTNTTLSWSASTGADSYTLQIGFRNNFNPKKEITGITNTSYPVQNLPANTRIYWRVSATNQNGTSGFPTASIFTTVSTTNLNATITYPNKTNPGDYNSTEYKLVGLPGDDNLTISSVVSGTQGTDWEAYWDNGNASDYFVKFNASNPFEFTAGTSYWIINKGNLTINKSVTAAPVGSAGTFPIPLKGGFNLITNPFTVSVDWSAVLTANGLPATTPLNSFSSSGWGNSTTMQPFAGYFFDNATSLSQLLIPYPIETSPLPKLVNQDIWRVKLNLSCNDFTDQTTSFGTSVEANNERDLFDHRKPRSMGTIPSAYFNHPEWDSEFQYFATDVRSKIETVQSWNLKVETEFRSSTELQFDGIESIPTDLEIYLLDQDRANYINLKEVESYEFIPAKDISDFLIIVGKPEFVNSQLDNILPSEFVLGSNFPNPFNPSTTIAVSIPERSELRLTIYNVLGQEVNVLFEGFAEPGRQWFVWNGKDQQGLTLPSGIYIYNLITSTGVNLSNKMILMK